MKPPVQRFRFFVLLAFAGACNWAFGGGAQAYIRLQPVQPQTDPPSSYAPGTNINGQEIILGSVPARVWFEIHVSGWAPDVLKVAQVVISATDPEMDGGGYAGSRATCMNQPAIGAGDLRPALQPCQSNIDCRASLSGSACSLGEPSKCVSWNGVTPPYFPAGNFCEPGFQNRCHPAWIGIGINGVGATDLSSLNYRIGFAVDVGATAEDYEPTYVGTLVLDVPPNAKGTYTIDFDETQTFLQNDQPPGGPQVPLPQLQVARVTVPCGRCCHDLGDSIPQCVDHVSANECAEYGAGAVFQANAVCPEQGEPACPECGLDEHCDDGQYCNGVEVCEANSCGPGTPPCESYEECEETTESCSPRIPAVSDWGLLILGFSLLILAKLRGKPVETG
jgi:hypothetical protein